MRALPTILISVLIQGKSRPPSPPSAVRAHAPLLSVLLHQRVEPPLQTSAVNTPPLPLLLSFTIQQEMLPLQPLSTCAPPPLLSVLLQGRGEPPLLSSTMHAYVPMISAFLICHTSDKPAPLPQLSALIIQQVKAFR